MAGHALDNPAIDDGPLGSLAYKLTMFGTKDPMKYSQSKLASTYFRF